MAGRHKPGYRRPHGGELREIHQPLLIDRLPPAVGQAILRAREAGKSWYETARLASKVAGRRVSFMACHRWCDAQARREERKRAEFVEAVIGALARTFLAGHAAAGRPARREGRIAAAPRLRSERK